MTSNWENVTLRASCWINGRNVRCFKFQGRISLKRIRLQDIPTCNANSVTSTCIILTSSILWGIVTHILYNEFFCCSYIFFLTIWRCFITDIYECKWDKINTSQQILRSGYTLVLMNLANMYNFQLQTLHLHAKTSIDLLCFRESFTFLIQYVDDILYEKGYIVTTL